MKHYAIAEINITDPTWVGEYVRNTTRLVERHGGRYLSRTTDIEKIEGSRPTPQIFLLIEWPSKEAAMGFYESEEYRPYLEARRRGSSGDFTLVAGDDVNRAPRMV